MLGQILFWFFFVNGVALLAIAKGLGWQQERFIRSNTLSAKQQHHARALRQWLRFFGRIAIGFIAIAVVILIFKVLRSIN
ncbi:hypothetical protein BH09PAT1_BH09PAT1_2830 [soil metagenome]